MIPQCRDHAIGVLPWSPRARGWLAGTHTREGERRTTRAETDSYADQLYGRPEAFGVIDRVAEMAGEQGSSPAQLALAWLLHKPGVTAQIIGARPSSTTSKTRSRWPTKEAALESAASLR